jgi:uncharacterized linocin/CFP29 family protein
MNDRVPNNRVRNEGVGNNRVGNNLHRGLAPISGIAWTDLEAEAKRTFTRHLAGRRVVDVPDPAGPGLAAVNTGHRTAVSAPPGVLAHARQSRPIIELRVRFTVAREQIDDVARGASDADWQPVKDAAKQMAFVEDRIIFQGYPEAGIVGIGPVSSNPTLTLPSEARAYPDAVSQALSALRLAGVDGPYALVLSAPAYTAVTETSDHGYPIHNHIARLLDGPIIWAPALDGAYLLSTRGGDFALHLGQDLSIGYLGHDATSVELYFEQSLTFCAYTAEAAVVLGPA